MILLRNSLVILVDKFRINSYISDLLKKTIFINKN